jgi:hypothetical protein
LHGNLKQSLADERIKAGWHWDPYHVPHPPFSRVVSGVTRLITAPWLDKFSGYRLAPALFFTVLVLTMFWWMKDVFGRATALFSALAVVLVPNLFGFAHIAVTDLPLASMWLTTAFCFWKGVHDWRWSVGLGVAWGLALATKFPAVLIPVPLLLWAHFFYRNRYANNVFALVFIAPLTMIAVQPYLWHQPGLRLLEFAYEGLSRAYRTDTNFLVYFFGQLYFTNQLPWHYPFFAVAITTPEPLLALALIGLLSIPLESEKRPAVTLFAINAMFILALGLLPGAVLHDGIRQLLSALPFVAALGGAGFFFLSRWLLRLVQKTSCLQSIKHLEAKCLTALGLLLLSPPLLDLYFIHPFQLSFYNRFVGGVRGAYERGLEITYAMEAFTPRFLNSLNERLPANATLSASFANFMFAYYQKEGQLRRDITITENGRINYYVLLNRRSVLGPRQRVLLDGNVPTFLSLTIAGVPLVGVFELNPP